MVFFGWFNLAAHGCVFDVVWDSDVCIGIDNGFDFVELSL